MNKVILKGHLGKDPDVRKINDTRVASFPVATDESYTDRNGDRVEKTEWHNVVAWGKLAELMRDHFFKGKEILLEGKIQTRNYEDKDGVRRYVTEVVMVSFEFCGRKGDEPARERPARAEETPEKEEQQPIGYDPEDDDLPF